MFYLICQILNLSGQGRKHVASSDLTCMGRMKTTATSRFDGSTRTRQQGGKAVPASSTSLGPGPARGCVVCKV